MPAGSDKMRIEEVAANNSDLGPSDGRQPRQRGPNSETKPTEKAAISQ
jgi:hypothetical protein